MNNYTNNDHTFVVCAYGESEYLTGCLDSLMGQKTKGTILISTSTPNEHIKKAAEKYGIELRINTNPPGISGDWNFAYKQACTRLVTLAHQDDIYLPDYLSTALELLNRAYKPIIFFSHYGEIKKDGIELKNLRLNVKKLMSKPMKIFWRSKFVRRRIMSFGNFICCPSVMYVDLEKLEFCSEYKFVLDWQKWEELSRQKGSFVYSEKPLLLHRLHDKAETSRAIQSGLRRQEDYMIFKKFWWAPIARILTRFYTKSEKDSV